MTVRSPAARVGAWRARLSSTLVWRCALRFVDITGYDRALGLAAQAFVATVPTMVVVSSLSGGTGSALADRVVARFGLSGDTADLVREALRPPADTGVTVWGICLLVVSGVGFTRALQRAFRAAWRVPRSPGWRGWVGGVGGALAVAAVVVAGLGVTALVEGFQGAGPVAFVARAFLSGVLWLVAIRLLLGWSLPWQPFLPGAVVAGAGTAAVWVVSEVWLPRAFISQAGSYGLVGIVVVLISWLILIALLLVCAAVVSAELWHARAAPAAAPGSDPAP
ncbi:YhjD/YihY/BrkB family envelope integrity protein [Geodermatophilus sp. SYSU D00766]